MEIGQRIKDLRISLGLTQEELASRCELSKGFISQIERDLTSPSITTLEDILQALGTNLSLFFQAKENLAITFSQNDFFIKEEKDYSIEWIIPDAQKNDMEPIRLVIAPGATSFIAAPHEGQEFGYVLSGELQLEFGQQRYHLSAGETFYLCATQSRCIHNTSSSPATLLWISTPPTF